MAEVPKQVKSNVSKPTKLLVKPKKSQSSKISDELRKAVKDLGGDEEDLELIEGIDEDDDEQSIPAVLKGKGTVSEEVRFIRETVVKDSGLT